MPSGSRRRQVEKAAAKLRRAWLFRRGLKSSSLPPATAAALIRWSESAARLALADEVPFDRWLVAAQNSEARLARALEELAAAAGPSAEDEMRALLSTPPVVDEVSEGLDASGPPDDDYIPDEIAEELFDQPDAEWGETLASIEADDPPLPEPPPAPRRRREPPDPRAWVSEKSRSRSNGLPDHF